MFTVYLNVKNN